MSLIAKPAKERKRITSRTRATSASPDNEDLAKMPIKKPAVKKTPKKPPVAVPRLSAKELFEIKPTKKFNLQPWQQGVAIGDQDMPDVGIPFPSFCWEMFVGHSVLPLSSCYALAGPTGSFKSHLVLEMARWVLNSGGYTILAENESKYNKDMANAVIGPGAKDVFVCKCHSFNEVQKTLISSIKKADAEKDDLLMLHIIDSIVGNATDSQHEKIQKEGSIERGYPSNALAAANFLPTYMPMLGNKPYLGVWVTHSKEEKYDPYRAPTVELKGGGNWQYRCRIAFILNRITEKPEYHDRTWSIRLLLTLKKDAAIRGFRLPFDIRCRHISVSDEKTGDVYAERVLKFCWHAATLDIWQNPEKYGYPAFYAEVVKDLTGLAEASVEGSRKKGFIAPKIGIGKSEASRDPKVIMDALYGNESVLNQMRAEMGIQRGIELSPEKSFSEAGKEAKKIAHRRVLQSQETANIVLLKREEIEEFD